MKHYILLATCALAMLFVSCRSLDIKTSVYDTYPATPGRLDIYQSSQQLPADRIQIGTVTVGDKGFTPTKDCTYQCCLDAIQNEAKKMGGEFIHIVQLREPGIWSTCYSITADIYRYKIPTNK